MFSLFLQAKKFISNIIFPPLCISCERHPEETVAICRDCLEKIKIHNSFFCPVCSARLGMPKLFCNHNRKKFGGYPFILSAATNYNDPSVQKMIYFLKYHGFESIMLILKKIMSEYLALSGGKKYFQENNFIIVPLPLYIFKKWQRGFNQAELIANEAARFLELPVKNLLQRVKHSKPQAKTKNFIQRKENVKNIFQVATNEEIKGKNIILVDDVYTSGATSKEAIKVLKSAGAKQIVVLVFAKT